MLSLIYLSHIRTWVSLVDMAVDERTGSFQCPYRDE